MTELDAAVERAARILFVEDERSLVGIMALFLGGAGYEVAIAYEGESALRRLRAEPPDLVLLDLGLPNISGEEVYRAIEERGIPIVVVTGRRDAREVARFLEMGAEDYLTKPFAKEELIGRVRAVLRRAGPRLRLDDVVVDLRTYEARVNGRLLDLTPVEFALFACLSRGGLVTISELLRAGWRGERADRDLVRGPMYRLRSKLAAAGSDLDVENVRTVGYRLTRRGEAATETAG